MFFSGPIYGTELLCFAACVIALTVAYYRRSSPRIRRNCFIAAALFFCGSVTAAGVAPPLPNSSGSQAATEATPSPDSPAPPLIGESGTLGAGAYGLPCTPTKDQLHAAIDAVAKNDTEGFREATADSTVLKDGLHILVLERDGFAGLDMRMRIQDGPDAGTACWVEADRSNLFK
jgi:hypothetical protein